MTTPLSQHQKILGFMITRTRGPDTWFLASDFMQRDCGPYFVGYEASARLSELAHLHPDVIESRRNGKFIERRLKIENKHLFRDLLPADLYAMFATV